MKRIPNTFIKPSTIHGLGLFAKKDILEGEQIIQGLADFNICRDEWISYVKKCKIKSFEYNNGYCMVNHSATSNTKRSIDMRIFASENIKCGDEITEDYYDLPDKENPFIEGDLSNLKHLNLEKILFDIKHNQLK